MKYKWIFDSDFLKVAVSFMQGARYDYEGNSNPNP